MGGIIGILIEKEQKRSAKSVNNLKTLGIVRTIDCDLFRSAESIIKEVPNNASLSKLLETLYGKEDIFDDFGNILCGYNPKNKLHSNLLSDREVSGIEIFNKMRRVDLIWSKRDNETSIWRKLNLFG